MDDVVTNKVRKILTDYLEQNHKRKTPERYAILDTVYSMSGHFTLEELNEELEQQNFHVSKATLYNTMNLLLSFRLVVRHNLKDGTKYEASYRNVNHCHQICTICGKITEINSPIIVEAVSKARLKRFLRDSFSLYIYGVCSSCQTKINRQKAKQAKAKLKPKKK